MNVAEKSLDWLFQADDETAEPVHPGLATPHIPAPAVGVQTAPIGYGVCRNRTGSLVLCKRFGRAR